MNLDTTFEALVLLLVMDPANERIDSLVLKLVQLASGQDPATTDSLLLRSIRWDDPAVYDLLDALLLEHAFELTVRPGKTTGLTLLGIKPVDYAASAALTVSQSST